jgi:putative intracellular protease/amidase
MRARQFWQRVLFLFFGLFLAVAGMPINAQAAPPLGSSLAPNAAGQTGLQIASEAKQALLVIFPWFPEPEYSETRSILENKGIKVLVASSSVDPLLGWNKKLTVKPDMLLSQVRTAEYDAIVFIGTWVYPGDNADAIRIAKEGAADGEILACYFTAISTLIKADVLNGKRVASISDCQLQDAWVAELRVSQMAGKPFPAKSYTQDEPNPCIFLKR